MRKAAISVSVLTLIATLLVPMQANAATAKAGAKCTKLKATQIVGTKKFTCIKSGSKLVWDKGVAVPKASTPKPPVAVVKKSQEIDFPALADVALLDKQLSFKEAITTGGLVVSLSASGACSYDVASNSVLLNSVGKCSITASQAGDANYLPAPSITRSFEIIKIVRSIEIQEFDIQDLAEAQGITISFTSEDDRPDVVMASSTTDICTVDGDEVTFANAGTYSLTFSVQVTNLANSVERATFWLKTNNVDYPDSATELDLQPRKSAGNPNRQVLTINYVATATAGQQVQLYWSGTSTDLSVESLPAGTSPVSPAVPSIILTAVQVMYTQLGQTGATGVQGSTGATGVTPANIVLSDITGLTGATQLTNLVEITQTGYNLIVTPDPNTLYVIVGP